MAIEVFGYLNIICAIIGAFLFIYSIFIIKNIMNLLPTKAKILKNWKLIDILIIFFLAGYIVNILAVIFNINEILLIMQAFVYAFGALFVLIVVRLSHKTYKILKSAADSKE